VREAAFVILNPASAGGRTLRRWPATMLALKAAGVPFEVHRTTGPGDATHAVRAALQGGRRIIVAVGGDGTLNEVVNGFFDSAGGPIGGDAMLGLLPSGTGGDFRRAVGIPSDIDAAARLIAVGSVRRIDAGRIEFAGGERRFFINIADCGMGGEVVARVNRSTYKGGGARGSAIFLGTSLATLLRYVSRTARIDIDGTVIERDVRSVVIANGRYFGGGMHVAPNAVFDDGQFDVIVIGETGRTRALTGIPSLYRGRHLNRREVEVYRARTVQVTCDGEPMLFDVEGDQVGTTPATLTCLPDAITLCVPQSTGGRVPAISC
jgi:YegS/Rv2252/BmrU family lipid kinase